MISAGSRDYGYASAAGIVAESFRIAFRAPARVSVADHAAAHRKLKNAGGGYVGRWSHAEAPYLVEPMEALADQDVGLIGPGQCAKTSIGENWMLQSVDCDPAPMLWYMQSKDAVDSYVKNRINPMIEDHDILKTGLVPGAVNNSLTLKNFGSMRVEFLGASRSTMISRSAGRIFLDEIDAYDESLGDPVQQANVRRQAFGADSRLLVASHCDKAGGMRPDKWTAGSAKFYGGSDQRLWYWPCVECGCWSSPHPAGRWHMPIVYPEDADLDTIEREARLLCPHCGSLLGDETRRTMLQFGKWVGLGEVIAEDGTITGMRVKRRTAGFWIVGAMSLFTDGGIGGLARARVEAERLVADEGDRALREVIVKRWGYAYDPPKSVSAVDATVIADRAEPDLEPGIVPSGIRFLTGMIDVQANRFEWLVRGWGPGGESTVIDIQRIVADPATDLAAWVDTLTKAANAAYRLADGSGRVMRVRAFGCDSGGQPGVTEMAYAAWRRMKRGRLVRKYGMIAKREAWSLLLLKGASSLQAPRLEITYPDARKDRRASARGEVPVGNHNPNIWKDALAGQLAVAAPGVGYIHFPAEYRGNWGMGGDRSHDAPHTLFEQLTAERRLKTGRWEQIKARNELIDLLTGAHVMAHLIGLGRFDWDTPPLWAAEWDRNAEVSAARLAVVESGVVADGGILPQPPAAAPVPPAPLSGAGGWRPGRMVMTQPPPGTPATASGRRYA